MARVGTSTLTGLALLAVVTAWATPIAAQQASEDGRRIAGSMRLGTEYDDNVGREEGDEIERGFLSRYFTSLELASRITRDSLVAFDLNHGGKLFFDSAHTDADTLLTQASLSYQQRLMRHFGGFVQLDIRDRTERVSWRDYNRGGAGAGIDFWFSNFGLRAGSAWRYFAYKPASAASSTNVEGFTRMRFGLLEGLTATAGYTLARRGFHTQRYVLEEELVVPDDDTIRRDLFHVVHAGIGYRGKIVADASYSYALNASNSYGQSLKRHSAELTLTAPLPFELFVSAHLELQRTLYDDPVLLDADFIVDEDNRNALVLSLARTFAEDWEVESRYSLYLQEFGVGTDYRRQTILLALGYLFG